MAQLFQHQLPTSRAAQKSCTLFSAHHLKSATACMSSSPLALHSSRSLHLPVASVSHTLSFITASQSPGQQQLINTRIRTPDRGSFHTVYYRLQPENLQCSTIVARSTSILPVCSFLHISSSMSHSTQVCVNMFAYNKHSVRRLLFTVPYSMCLCHSSIQSSFQRLIPVMAQLP